MDKVVLDMDMPYHVPSRDAFCRFWREQYGQYGEALEAREGGRKMAISSGIPLAPTATSYVAYLYRTGLADNLYHFTNVLVHGSRPSFVRVKEEEDGELVLFEEEEGEFVLSELEEDFDLSEEEDSVEEEAEEDVVLSAEERMLRKAKRTRARVNARNRMAINEAVPPVEEVAAPPVEEDVAQERKLAKARRARAVAINARKRKLPFTTKGQETRAKINMKRKLPKDSGGGGEPTCAAERDSCGEVDCAITVKEDCNGAPGCSWSGSPNSGSCSAEDVPSSCCGDLVCDGNQCEVTAYGGGRVRKLSISNQGLLVEG